MRRRTLAVHGIQLGLVALLLLGWEFSVRWHWLDEFTYGRPAMVYDQLGTIQPGLAIRV